MLIRKKIVLWALPLLGFASVFLINFSDDQANSRDVNVSEFSSIMPPPALESLPASPRQTVQPILPTQVIESYYNKSIYVSESVQLAITDDSELSFSLRLQSIERLDRSLGQADLSALLEYLTKDDGEIPMNAAQVRVLKNEIMNLLRNQTSPPAGLTEALCATFKNKNQDPLVRDYALQHISDWYVRAPDDQLGIIERVLGDALAETDAGIAGTALIGLDMLRQSGAELDWERISAKGLDLLRDDRTSPATRMTALQVVGRWAPSDVAMIAKEIMQDPNQTVALRVSAFAALGDYGDASLADVLEKYASSPSSRFRVPAAAALERLRSRFDQAI